MTEGVVEASRSIPESSLKGDDSLGVLGALPSSPVEAPAPLGIVAVVGIACPFAEAAAIEESAAMHAAEKQAIRDRRAP